MENPSDYRITTPAQLREMFGLPNAVTPKKLLTALDETSMDFIRRAPFIVLGTADAEGNQDVSPKGDGPGFVIVENQTTLYIPERKGNKLMFGFQNILANPHVAVIFMVPGTNETLRVNGTAELTRDPAILARMPARGSDALLAIRVTVRECFFHCAKAFIRSQLWQHESWPAPKPISFGKLLAPKIGTGDEMARQIDRAVERDYKENL